MCAWPSEIESQQVAGGRPVVRLGGRLRVSEQDRGLLAADEDGEADDGDDEPRHVDQQGCCSHVRRSPWPVA